MSKTMRLIHILIVYFCLVFSEAFAADEKILLLRIDDGTGKQQVKEIKAENGAAEYISELGGKVLSVDLGRFNKELPEKIIIRTITGWAVSDDGPWIPLEGIDRAGVGEKIPSTSLTVALPEQHEGDEPALSLEEYDIAYRNLENSESAERWLPVLKTCRKGPVSGACYSYHAADEIRFTWWDKTSVTLKVFYPGGC